MSHQTRYCFECKQTKPLLTAFYERPRSAQGRDTTCAECRCKEAKVRYQRRKIKQWFQLQGINQPGAIV